MCGFIVSRGEYNDRFIRRRGPDWHSAYERDGFTFRHYLLHITGEMTPQPYVHGDIVCVYNGEIYNHPFVRSDGENIIPMYLHASDYFPRLLDGELAIALYDFAMDLAYFVTDRFATKPLWRKGAECASYESGVGGERIPANTIDKVRISTGELIARKHYHVWDWRQTFPSYDDCLYYFEQAVAKRYKPECFIGLSSGYDSGAIACALRGKDFKSYAVLASENPDILYQRAGKLGSLHVIPFFDIVEQEHHLAENAEEFHYSIRYDDGPGNGSYKDDYAAKALSYICQLASEEGRKVCLSGMGADEILSDYSLIPRQSEFKGVFPRDLKPWANFTGSCMESYLMKEEMVAGSWGIETRYPYLDTAFVQAFLSLTPELKNRNYKAPLYEYLTAKGFPFAKEVKIGWSPACV